MNAIIRHIAPFALVLALLTVAACGPGPKPQMLDDLELQLQDPSAREVKDAPGASKPYREARQYRRLSLEAWEEGKSELSEEYAVLGLLRYRTAVAISEQHEAKARLDAANAKVGTSNPEIKALNQEQVKLAEEVQALEMQVAQARRQKEEAERRAAALRGQQNMQQANQQDAAKKAQLQSKLNEVQQAKTAADAVNASTHAPAKYNPAVNTLKSIETLLASNQLNDAMLAEAGKALTLFQEAKTEAEPKFQEEREKQNPALRRQKLLADAESTFGGPYVVTEPAGARVVLAGAFGRAQTQVDPGSQRLLQELATLAKKYDEFTIYIEGYTSKGDATENLGISQLRAKAVKDYLEANGVKGSRIETKGQGQDRPRYPSDPSKNDRVEVVFTR